MPRLTSSTAHPLQTLRENTEALEASILVCLRKLSKDGVHRLRTVTRRIEAQLELLSMLPGLPPHQKQARKAERLLKRLRRAAGRVRDLDVQRDLIGEEAAKKKRGPRPNAELRKEAKELRRTLKRKRNEEAKSLLQLLEKRRAAFTLVFENLLEALGPAESISLSEERLASLVRGWYAQHAPGSKVAPQEPAELHGIRKRAKVARYLAESAPKSAASARRLAVHFEGLQQAGGEWHDWLLLQQLSAEELGKSATLPQRFAARADDSLRAYKRRLAKHATETNSGTVAKSSGR